MHNLEPVAFLDQHNIERTSRNDLEIAFDGDFARLESQLMQDVGESQPDRHVAKVAVDVNRDAFLELHRGSQ